MTETNPVPALHYPVSSSLPTLPAASITPAGILPFPSPNVDANDTQRIPPDLTSFKAARHDHPSQLG